MTQWQYSLHVIFTNPEQFVSSESGLNARGEDGWEAVAAIPMTGLTGLGKAVVLLRKERPTRGTKLSAQVA